MDGSPFMPDRQIATRDLSAHSRDRETVSRGYFVNSLPAIPLPSVISDWVSFPVAPFRLSTHC